MKTQSNFQDHLKQSKDIVSKWPSWKRNFMGVSVNKEKSGNTTVCYKACKGSSKTKE